MNAFVFLLEITSSIHCRFVFVFLLSVKYQCCARVSVISYGSPHLEADILVCSPVLHYLILSTLIFYPILLCQSISLLFMTFIMSGYPVLQAMIFQSSSVLMTSSYFESSQFVGRVSVPMPL